LQPHGVRAITALLRRRSLFCAFNLEEGLERTLRLLEKYSEVPMSLADACLLRMTESLDEPLLLTTDTDFHIYRRHSRQAVPCVTPIG
jgi:hypothetical protein